jgi:hypothetical protein
MRLRWLNPQAIDEYANHKAQFHSSTQQKHAKTYNDNICGRISETHQEIPEPGLDPTLDVIS